MAVIARGAAAARRTDIADAHAGGAIVLLYLIGVVFSEQPSVDVLGLRMTPIRMLLLVVFIPAAITLFRIRDLRLRSFDWFIVAAVAWLSVGLYFNNGPERALKFGGSLVLEALGGYLVARAYVRTPAQFGRTVQWYVWLVAIVGVIALPEALSGVRIFAFLETGAPDEHFALPPVDDNYVRLGLHRAAVTVVHPIHYGVFCATSFGLAWYT
jgi:hypothetical protein